MKETAEKLKGYTINKLLTFNDPPWRFYLPALCIAIQWKNKEMVHCLLENGKSLILKIILPSSCAIENGRQLSYSITVDASNTEMKM